MKGGGSGARTPGEKAAGTGALSVTRLIGRVRGDKPGPTLAAVGGIHGNEPAGVHALRRVFDRLAWPDVELAGEFLALAGNVRALAQNRRFIKRDLNRAWMADRVALLEQGALPEDESETHEQRELKRVLDAAIDGARGELTFLDLHSTSAAGLPFAVVSDTVRGHELARHFPLPVILGLDDILDGILCEYMSRRGCRTMAVEGGQHDAEETVAFLEAAVWLALSATGVLMKGATREINRAYRAFDRARGNLPRVMEVLTRHAIAPEDEFRMEPGFANIGPARKGQLLACDRHGPIRASRDGLVILPLYQGQGDDGFFFGRGVPPWRLWASTTARQLGIDALLGLLPGVERDAVDENRLLLDGRAAWLYPRALFHLFGFRKLRQRGEGMVATRTPEAQAPPAAEGRGT